MSNLNNYGNSSFWLDRNDSEFVTNLLSDSQKAVHELYHLAGKKRAISNFVSIVTGKRIPVKFAIAGNSYTDGNTVVISSKLDKAEDFDVAVGLALHEGSHIKLSSFEFLIELSNQISNLDDYFEIRDVAEKAGISLHSNIKDILNWVEDRRIDDFIYQSSPGYRDYYIALYDKYFNDALIDKALKSTEYTEENFDSYMFRLINLQSKSTRLKALNGLREISKIADLGNISRLQSTQDAFEVAVDIFRVILKNVKAQLVDDNSEFESQTSENPPPQSNFNSNELSDADFDNLLDSLGLNDEPTDGDGNDSTDGDGNDSTDGDGNDSTDGDGTDSTDGDGTDSDNSDSTSNKKSTSGGSKSISVKNLPDNVGDGSGTDINDEIDEEPLQEISLSDRQKSILKKKIDKQKEFINGEFKKSKMAKADAESIDVIEKADAEIKEVGKDYQANLPYHKSTGGVNCIFVKNMTRDLMEDDTFPLTRTRYNTITRKNELAETSKEAVEIGLRLGIVLGKKLQTHSESRETIFNRQLTGKLDRRMVSSLGYGSEQVFYTKETDSYNKANLHISIDASGSMNGEKWKNTITNVVALAKAVDMISTLNIQITFRTTSDTTPYIVVGYDSRKDKLSKLKKLFPYLSVGGTTPEGLCFEAISNYMVAGSNSLDSYFLNLSDGEPYFFSKGFYYSGYPAAGHTKSMIDNMKRLGIKVLSYFVDGNSTINTESLTARIFKQSYGDAAKFIDVTSVSDVAKTMNRLFLSK